MLTYECAEFKLLVIHELNKFNVSEQNVDFHITVDNNTYAGTAVTLKNIEYLMEKYKDSGECNYGRYFRQHDMVILAEMSLDCLCESLLDILKDKQVGILDDIFYKIPYESEE